LRPADGWQKFWAYREALRYYGAAAFLLTAALALLHYAAVGPYRVPLSGRTVRRFPWSEVLMHLVLALTFLLLWASGLYLLLNRLVLEQPHPFWGHLANDVHIWTGLLFLVGLVAMWVKWRSDMRLAPYDGEWLRHAGGYLRRHRTQLPAGRFNAGQKIWFRGALLFGAVLGVTGLLLYYPGGLGLTPSTQRVLFVLHTVAALAMTSGVLIHVYLATLATPGSLAAMVTGRMDEALIRAHHTAMMPIRGGAPDADRRGGAELGDQGVEGFEH
jgi:formate dehydrogenase subunit gamma